MLGCANTSAPILARFALFWRWSPWECEFVTIRIGLSEILRTAPRIWSKKMAETVVGEEHAIVASLHHHIIGDGDDVDLVGDATGDKALLEHLRIARIVQALEAAKVGKRPDAAGKRRPLHRGSRAHGCREGYGQDVTPARLPARFGLIEVLLLISRIISLLISSRAAAAGGLAGSPSPGRRRAWAGISGDSFNNSPGD